MIVGNLVAGKRIAQACGRDVAQLEDNDQARKVGCAAAPWSTLPVEPITISLLFQLVCNKKVVLCSL